MNINGYGYKGSSCRSEAFYDVLFLSISISDWLSCLVMSAESMESRLFYLFFPFYQRTHTHISLVIRLQGQMGANFWTFSFFILSLVSEKSWQFPISKSLLASIGRRNGVELTAKPKRLKRNCHRNSQPFYVKSCVKSELSPGIKRLWKWRMKPAVPFFCPPFRPLTNCRGFFGGLFFPSSS